MINVGVLEDEENCFSSLKDCLLRYGEEFSCTFSIEHFPDGITFLESDCSKYDIIFLDIQVPVLDGMQVAKKIREKDKCVIIIFITNFASYAIRGYEVEAMDYVLKPVKYTSMQFRLDKAIRKISERRSQSITLHLNRENVRVLTSDILFVEANRHKCIYHTEYGDFEVWQSFAEAKKALDTLEFAQCHGSYLCNLRWVRRIDVEEVILKTGISVRLSRNYKKQFWNSFTTFWADYGG